MSRRSRWSVFAYWRRQSRQSVHGASTCRLPQYWHGSVVMNIMLKPSTFRLSWCFGERALRLLVEGFVFFTLNSVFLR